MTLARIKATGQGRLNARVSVEGWPYEFVTASAMTKTTSDGRIRISGLQLDSLRKWARADLARASLTAQGFHVRVVDDQTSRLATLALGKRPQLTTWCEPAGASISDSDVTVPVADTTGWPASGVAHIATEAFSYTGKTGTSFTGCTRGIWNTPAQYHYAPDGAGLSFPRVTDVPQSLEGRRVRVYLYGEGDDPQGDGTQEVLGIASTDRSYDSGEWSFSVDPLTRIFDQEVGGDLEAPVPIRGIYYPWNAPFVLTLSALNISRSETVTLTGFFETQQAFCEALTTAIATAVAAWPWAAGSSITAQVVHAAESWQLKYRVGTGVGTVADVTIAAPTAVALTGRDSAGTSSDLDVFGAGNWFGDDYALVMPSDFVAGRLYQLTVLATVPRAARGARSPRERDGRYGLVPDEASASIRKTYLGGLVAPTAGMEVAVDVEGSGRDDAIALLGTVGSADAATRSITISSGGFITMGPATRLYIGRRIARGTLEDFRAALVAAAPAIANAGGGPLVTGGDWAASTDVADAAAELPTGADRVFSFFQGVKLRELVEHECRAIGCFLRLNASGAIEVRRVRPTLPTDRETWAFNESNMLSRPKVERAAFGQLSSVIYRTGYDPLEDEWSGSVRVRDVSASSPTRVSGELEIKQRSVAGARFSASGTSLPEVSPDEVVQVAAPTIGIFGGTYDIATFEVPYTCLDLLLGDLCTITHPYYPNDDGTLGVTDLVGMVTGYDFQLGEGKGTVEVLVHGQRYAGYAFGLRVTGQAFVGGTTWDITVSLSPYTDETDIANLLVVGSLVRVCQQDTSAPTDVDGTVASFVSATVVRVTLAGAWVPAGEYCLRARTSDKYADVTDDLGAFTFVARATRKVDYATTDADAREWAP